ncbi:unnamed protein product [Sphagnum troendelagicum]|uniref:Uncharacterized protein n=1 Tax=Sphagnum troendelagicum TaxID=128251 RepID=A0ABP0UVV6_9BRYO
MEEAPEAQGQPGEALGPRARPQHTRYQLDVRRHQTQKTSDFPVEEHSPRLDEREARALQNRADQLSETLKQPVFGNPHIVNHEGKPLGLSGRSEGNSLAKVGCSRVRDFWDPEEKEWKGLFALG